MQIEGEILNPDNEYFKDIETIKNNINQKER